MSDSSNGYGDMSQPLDELHPNERGKADSHYLRGTIAEGLADPVTGAISEADAQLTKFHGIYMQDDRDLRDERRRQKLEPAYQFMIRVQLPGGVCTPAQWLQLDELARTHANGTLRITTRQTFQFHGVLKGDLKPTVQGINQALLDTIAACASPRVLRATRSRSTDRRTCRASSRSALLRRRPTTSTSTVRILASSPSLTNTVSWRASMCAWAAEWAGRTTSQRPIHGWPT